MKKKLSLILVLLLPLPAFAFKIDTHVWVAQQVINDLQGDGSVAIPPFGEFAVDSMVTNAILTYPEVYRSGNIGPDGYPDFIGGQLTVHPGLVNNWKSDDWLRHVLLSAQSPKEKAFAYGYLGHAATDTFAHTYVNWYSGDHYAFGNADHGDVELRHIRTEQYIVKHQPPMKNNSGVALSIPNSVGIGTMPTSFISQTLIRNDAVLNQYNQAGAYHLSAMYNVEKTLDRLIIEARNAKQYDPLNQLISLQIQAVDLSIQLAVTPLNVLVSVCNRVCSWLPWPLGEVCDSVCRVVSVVNDEYTRILSRIGDLNDKIAAMERYLTITSLLEGYLGSWKSDAIGATREYINMSSKVSRELLKGSAGNPMGEVRHWISCSAPAYIGVPSVIPSTACALGSALSSLTLSFSPAERLILSAAGVVLAPIDRIRAQIADIESRLMTQILNTTEVGKVIIALTTPVTDSNLSSAFRTVGGGILPIPDIASRLRGDMHVDANGWFSPEDFNPAYNAVILAKLSLLSSSGLTKLISKAGMSGVYPQANILFKSISSLDGDHAWMNIAPPHVRQAPYPDVSPIGNRTYGYPFNGTTGFVFWANEGYRSVIFNRIFKGPVASGIQMPGLVDMPEILPATYDYAGCGTNIAFPPFMAIKNRNDGRSCVPRWGEGLPWLVPVISLILN